MNVYKNPDILFKRFGGDYHAYKKSRIKLVDDSVILICGLKNYRSAAFEVNYSCIPIFSRFSLASSYLNDPCAFSAARESNIKPLALLLIDPKPEDEAETLEIASAHADFAYERLERIKTLDDCLEEYERSYDSLLQEGILCSPSHFILHILIFRREFEKCSALLEKTLLDLIRSIFDSHGVGFPEDGNWRKYLPESGEEAKSKFQRELCWAEEHTCWKDTRTALEEHRYYELCSKLMQNYQTNKKLLKKAGILLGEKSDAMMEAMMKAVEDYR